MRDQFNAYNRDYKCVCVQNAIPIYIFRIRPDHIVYGFSKVFSEMVLCAKWNKLMIVVDLNTVCRYPA